MRVLLAVLLGLSCCMLGAAEKLERAAKPESAAKANATAGTAAPVEHKLYPAGWIGSPVSLDDVKGNVVLLAFYNPDCAS